MSNAPRESWSYEAEMDSLRCAETKRREDARALLNEWTISLIGVIYDNPSKAQRDTLKAITDGMLALRAALG